MPAKAVGKLKVNEACWCVLYTKNYSMSIWHILKQTIVCMETEDKIPHFFKHKFAVSLQYDIICLQYKVGVAIKFTLAVVLKTQYSRCCYGTLQFKNIWMGFNVLITLLRVSRLFLFFFKSRIFHLVKCHVSLWFGWSKYIKGSYKPNGVIRYLYMQKSYLLLFVHVCLFSAVQNIIERCFYLKCGLHFLTPFSVILVWWFESKIRHQTTGINYLLITPVVCCYFEGECTVGSHAIFVVLFSRSEILNTWQRDQRTG